MKWCRNKRRLQRLGYTHAAAKVVGAAVLPEEQGQEMYDPPPSLEETTGGTVQSTLTIENSIYKYTYSLVRAG